MKRTMLAIGLLSIALATPALCAEKTKTKKMAMMDCHKEMMEACKEKMGKNSCPMMGDMGQMHRMMGKGMKHDHGKMKNEEPEGDETK